MTQVEFVAVDDTMRAPEGVRGELVMFRSFVAHIVRVCRVLKLHRTHLALYGKPGAGKGQ